MRKIFPLPFALRKMTKKVLSLQVRTELSASIFWNSTFHKIYKPIIVGFGRMFGLNTYIDDKGGCSKKLLIRALVINRMVSFLSIIIVWYRLIAITINNQSKFGLNATTLSLIHSYATDSLVILNSLIIIYLDKPFIKLAFDINDLNPYKGSVNYLQKAQSISLALLAIFILLLSANGIIHLFAALEIMHNLFDWTSPLIYAVPLSMSYSQAIAVYPFLLLSIVTTILCCILKTLNDELEKLVDEYRDSDDFDIQVGLATIQGKFQRIVKLVRKTNDLFSNICTMDFSYAVVMLCVTSSILCKARDIGLRETLIALMYLMEFEIVMAIVAIPGIVLFIQGQKPIETLLDLLGYCNERISNNQRKFQDVINQISSFVQHIESANIGLSMSYFFIITPSLLLTVASVILTYFLVILQMDADGQPNSLIQQNNVSQFD